MDFVKQVVEDPARRDRAPIVSDVVSSLRDFVRTLESPDAIWKSSIQANGAASHQADRSMPPSEAAVAVLRWAKGKSSHPSSEPTNWQYQITSNSQGSPGFPGFCLSRISQRSAKGYTSDSTVLRCERRYSLSKHHYLQLRVISDRKVQT